MNTNESEQQDNFARVQEQAKQLSELRDAIMGGTGAKAIATHKQLLEKVVAEHQRLQAAESIAAHYKTELLSAQAAIEKFKAYLELYFIKGVLRFDDGKDYRQVARELISVSPDLSLIHRHDAEVRKPLVNCLEGIRSALKGENCFERTIAEIDKALNK